MQKRLCQQRASSPPPSLPPLQRSEKHSIAPPVWFMIVQDKQGQGRKEEDQELQAIMISTLERQRYRSSRLSCAHRSS